MCKDTNIPFETQTQFCFLNHAEWPLISMLFVFSHYFSLHFVLREAYSELRLCQEDLVYKTLHRSASSHSRKHIFSMCVFGHPDEICINWSAPWKITTPLQCKKHQYKTGKHDKRWLWRVFTITEHRNPTSLKSFLNKATWLRTQIRSLVQAAVVRMFMTSELKRSPTLHKITVLTSTVL